MQTLPVEITNSFHVTDKADMWELKCKGCGKEFKVGKPAEGKAINNLVLRNVLKHASTHPSTQPTLPAPMEEEEEEAPVSQQIARERGADTSYDDKGEPVALPLTYTEPPSSDHSVVPEASYPFTYQVVFQSGNLVDTTRIDSVMVYTEPRVDKNGLGETGYTITLHAANPRHAESIAQGIINKILATPKKRLTWKDRARARKQEEN